MAKREQRSRKKLIGYSPKEFEQLTANFSLSASRNLNEYIRKLSLQEPVYLVFTNSSVDKILDEFVEMRNRLENILETRTLTTNQIEELKDIKRQIGQSAKTIIHVCENHAGHQHQK